VAVFPEKQGKWDGKPVAVSAKMHEIFDETPFILCEAVPLHAS
jgi:hypothetical protein